MGRFISVDGNTAAAMVAHATNEIIAIYPITPSSVMGELADELSAAGQANLWGTVPTVSELQSEGGASGAIHGALSAGALSTTFTASQGLLLMIPNMFKIAGELLPTVFHVSARAVACQALSIFGDHSDVMACRSTGFGLLASGNVQEVHDFALISQAASLESRVPFVHFFDGFRTSHEIQKIRELTQDEMRQVIKEEAVLAHRGRGLSPDRPVLRGTAQNPDIYFQGRETVNPYYVKAPGLIQEVMDRFAKVTGRQYHLFDYFGDAHAENVIVLMGSGAETAHETVEYLNAKGEKLGIVKVRIYRPFDVRKFINILPASVKRIAVLDRTKEPGALGEPLYEDVQTALREAGENGWRSTLPNVVVGGRYGLGSKEFTPAMVKAIFDNLKVAKPRNHFTIGIKEDVTHTSLDWDHTFSTEGSDVYRAMFYGLGADGTIGANKNSIKIIGATTENNVQGFFVYDSRKAGTMTTSHLRFGKKPIRSTYLITTANFVACHNFTFLEKYPMLRNAQPGATFLLNSPYDKDQVWDQMPQEVQQQFIDKKIRFYVIDATKLAADLGLGGRINTIMQASFFVISDIIPKDQASDYIKKATSKTYASKGEKVVAMNLKAVDAGVIGLHEVKYPATATSKLHMHPAVPAHAPEYVQKVTALQIENRGDEVPVSALPADGSYITGTTQYEKRNIAVEIPAWDPATCIQCGQCSYICPHAAIRIKAYEPVQLAKAPRTFKSADAKGGKELAGLKFTVQVAPEDCTGCGACVWNCPAYAKDPSGNKTDRKAINMTLQVPIRETERENYAFFLALPETAPARYSLGTVKGSQFVQPLFEYSGACGGCGETPYVKLLTQLFGDRLLIANATGCSSIYGGNLPTIPYTKRADGRGPSWSNSLFEDNAEFGLGMRYAVDKFREEAVEILQKEGKCSCLSGGESLIKALLSADQTTQKGVEEQRGRVVELKKKVAPCKDAVCQQLLSLADYLVEKSTWILGGDGWAYDIGYGGLDHVLASGRKVRMLVLDTEVYSNTGGQCSKSTPRGATAKFAVAGKPMPKKDLGMLSMTYGNIYVARVAMGANAQQTVNAFMEAEAYQGASIIIAYSHCIAQGIDMTSGLGQQKKAVNCGYWPLYRFHPDLVAQGKNPLQLDSKEPTLPVADYVYSENRYRILKGSDPKRAEELLKLAEEDVKLRWKLHQEMAKIDYSVLARTPAQPDAVKA